MRNRLSIVLCLSALWLGLAVIPAEAGSTRVQSFSLICDATNRSVIFNATGFTASSNQFVLGSTVSLTQPRGGINFLRVQAAGDPQKTVIFMGLNEVNARFSLPTFLQVTASAAGNIPFQIIGNCRGGGTLRGSLVLIFN